MFKKLTGLLTNTNHETRIEFLRFFTNVIQSEFSITKQALISNLNSMYDAILQSFADYAMSDLSELFNLYEILLLQDDIEHQSYEALFVFIFHRNKQIQKYTLKKMLDYSELKEIENEQKSGDIINKFLSILSRLFLYRR